MTTSTSPLAVVTGGAGFIGSHTVDLLLDSGCRVHVIDNLSGGHRENLERHKSSEKLRCFWEDVRGLEPGHEAFAGARWVFHFAGIGDIVPSIEAPSDYMAVNVQGTVRVLECARHAGVEKLVYAASSSCYGLAETPTPETAPIRPEYPYALSKNLGEQAALHWHQVYGLPVNSCRIFNAYGPRVRTTGAYGAVFGVFLRQRLAGKPLTIVGDGRQARDFVYVTDVARAFLAAANTSYEGRIWNVGGGAPKTVNFLAELIGGDTICIPKRPGEPEVTHADISRIRRDLAWSPQVCFELGVQRMLDDIQHWAKALNQFAVQVNSSVIVFDGKTILGNNLTGIRLGIHDMQGAASFLFAFE